jgi:hypothetical protein
MRRVALGLFVFGGLGLLCLPVYAGKPQKQQQQQARPTPTAAPTTNAAKPGGAGGVKDHGANRSSAAICCVRWDSKGTCLETGMIRGGSCPDPPTRVLFQQGRKESVTAAPAPASAENPSNATEREKALSGPDTTSETDMYKIGSGKGKMPAYEREGAVTTPTPGPVSKRKFQTISNASREGQVNPELAPEPVAATTPTSKIRSVTRFQATTTPARRK